MSASMNGFFFLGLRDFLILPGLENDIKMESRLLPG